MPYPTIPDYHAPTLRVTLVTENGVMLRGSVTVDGVLGAGKGEGALDTIVPTLRVGAIVRVVSSIEDAAYECIVSRPRRDTMESEAPSLREGASDSIAARIAVCGSTPPGGGGACDVPESAQKIPDTSTIFPKLGSRRAHIEALLLDYGLKSLDHQALQPNAELTDIFPPK